MAGERQSGEEGRRDATGDGARGTGRGARLTRKSMRQALGCTRIEPSNICSTRSRFIVARTSA